MKTTKTFGMIALTLLAIQAFAQTTPPAEEKAKLKKLERAYTSAKAQFGKQKTAATKKTYVDATVNYGTAVMLAGTLTPREKYPKALQLYREALKVDPKNKEALKNKKMIEDIYRSMGRPIPK